MALRDAVALVSLGFGVENLQHYASFAGLFKCIFIHVYLVVARALSLPTAPRHPHQKKRICKKVKIYSYFRAFINICVFWRGAHSYLSQIRNQFHI